MKTLRLTQIQNKIQSEHFLTAALTTRATHRRSPSSLEEI